LPPAQQASLEFSKLFITFPIALNPKSNPIILGTLPDLGIVFYYLLELG
jgi:hypothetical protein